MQPQAAAELTTDHDIQMGNLSLSHHTHSLYIVQDSIPIDTECPKTVLHELHLLIRWGALNNFHHRPAERLVRLGGGRAFILLYISLLLGG
jgi:hypothetical protein